MNFGLEGRNVLVFASSKGLGKATASVFARAGANVMITSRSLENVKKAAEEISSVAKGKVAWLTCDVTKVEDIKAVVEETVAKFGGIDVLVNNAGGPTPGTFEELEEKDWEEAFQKNLMSVVREVHYALPYLKASRGKIINITSISMKEPVNGLMLSNVFRLGVSGLAKTLSTELANDGVLVNTVGPGRIGTERVQQLDSNRAKITNTSVEEVRMNQEKEIPLGRYGEPEEFANAILFLGSSLNTYITGQTLVVDGGLMKTY